MNPNASGLERLVPEYVQTGEVTGSETLKLHLARYKFAASYVRPGRLLDIACGSGYGTKMLVEQSQNEITAVGVDISEEAIVYARDRYCHPQVQFVVADATSFSDLEGFDSIVSLETIEHLSDPEGFIVHLLGLLRPDGVLVGSVPTTPSVDANPHHLHDFTERSFRQMVERHGPKEVACFRQVQPYGVIPLLRKKEARARDIRPSLLSYYMTKPSSLIRRLRSTVFHGFNNHYITIVWKVG